MCSLYICAPRTDTRLFGKCLRRSPVQLGDRYPAVGDYIFYLEKGEIQTGLETEGERHNNYCDYCYVFTVFSMVNRSQVEHGPGKSHKIY